MARRITVLLAIAALSLPGCASRTARNAGLLFGTVATFTGVVMTHEVLSSPTPCEMPAPGEPDDWCLGAIGSDIGRVFPPMMLTSLGVTALVASAIASYIHRNDEEQGHGDRARHRNLR
jgi:hypothetical protein